MTQQIKIEPLEPAQGIQAGLKKLFLFNPDALNKIVGDMNDALGDAEQSATDAASSANAAANSAAAAAASESAVEQSATAAENAADAAKDSENAAKTSENNAAASATDAASSKVAAAKSAAAAAESAETTQQNEEILQQYVDDAGQYAANAAASSQDAAGFANDAEQYAEEAKQATAGKADKATTLAGYGITDAYTKTQVDQKINDVQGDVDTLNTKVPSNASASNKMATAAEISNLQNQIDENALEIKGLQGAGGALTATNLGSNPTQQSITEYAINQIWPNNTNFTWNASNPAASTFTDANGVARTAAEIFNGTWVNNTADNMRWQLTNTQNTTPAVFEWANVGQDIVGIASATTAGIIRVGDGSQMVVSPATGDISLDASKASEIRDTIGAIANDQGTVNAGKILGVGDDGSVVPVDNPVMGDYVIYWDSADTTDHSHAKPGVATPTDHGWYRVYKSGWCSGWCEQGGRQNNTSAPSGAFDTVYLHIPMKDKNYSFSGCFDIEHADTNSTVVLGIRRCRYSENDTPEKAIVATTFNIDDVSGATGHYFDWEVKGWAA